jgi:hypothetical protein
MTLVSPWKTNCVVRCRRLKIDRTKERDEEAILEEGKTERNDTSVIDTFADGSAMGMIHTSQLKLQLILSEVTDTNLTPS